MGDFFKNDKHNFFALGIIIATFIALNATDAEAGERECLSRIGYAEARGESIKGVVAVMKAAKSNAKQRGISVCKVKAKQSTPAHDVLAAYEAIAITVIASNNNGKANSWRSGGLKVKGGKLLSKVGGHTFWYVDKL